MKKAAKRKSDDEVEEPSKAMKGEHEVDESPEAAFLKAFEKNAKSPCPEVKHSSGNGGGFSVEALVLHHRRLNSNGQAKVQLGMFVLKVISSPSDPIVTTNVDALAFGMPTKYMEASPEEIAKDSHAKGPIVLEIHDAYNKTGYLGYITTNLDAASKNTKGSNDSSIETCVPGTKVIVSGLSCKFGKGAYSDNIFVNAKKISPFSSDVTPMNTATEIIRHLSSAAAQQVSSFLLSSTVGGFFDTQYNEVHLSQQAEIFKSKWAALPESAAARCEYLASINWLPVDRKATDQDDETVPKTENLIKNETISNALNAHAKRIRDMSGPDAARASSELFSVDLQKDRSGICCLKTPYVAALVQRNATPGSNRHGSAIELCNPATRDKLPSMFCDAKAEHVTFNGNIVYLDYKLTFVGNKAAAIDAIQEFKYPLLEFSNPTVCVKIGKRHIGPEGVGTLVDAKLEMALVELMPYMDHATTIHVFPRGAEDQSVDSHFPSTLRGFDFVDGIKKVGIRVSKDFIDTTMLGGRGVFIHKDIENATILEPMAGIGPSPSISKHGYQALSEASFEIDSLTAPPGKTIAFFVLYAGCAKDVAEKPSISTSTSDGEEQIATVVQKIGSSDAKLFLKETALVYATVV